MEKIKISLKYWLLGKKYFNAVKAMEFAEKFHNGKRKNGEPEFIHQLTITQFLRTFDELFFSPEETLCTGILHDVCEDYDVPFEEIESKFGKLVKDSTKLMTKKYRGLRLSDEEYYRGLATSPIASLVKGADRIHNHQSMVGVFSIEKQISYIEETEKFILPMLKSARNIFPEQESIYENEKLILKSQISLIKSIHESSK